MSLHLNGLASPSALGMHPGAFRNAIARVADPAKVGAGMVLAARGNVYGDVRNVDPVKVARARRANKAARRARAQARRR